MDKKEGLGLSYKEAFEIIPYELLLLMQRDKLRIASSDSMVEVTEEEFFKNKKL